MSWATSLYLMTSILGGAMLPPVKAHFGPRSSMMVAGLVVVAGGVLAALAPNVGFILAGRAIQGLGEGFLLALSYTLVRELFDNALVPRMALAMAAFGLPSLAICALLWRNQPPANRASVSAGENPFELGAAIRFGLLFGVITFAAKAAQIYFGEAGLYLAAAIAGLTDVDAIALSMAQLALRDATSVDAAVRAIVIAMLVNTLVKAVLAAAIGGAAMLRWASATLLAALLAGAATAYLTLT